MKNARGWVVAILAIVGCTGDTTSSPGLSASFRIDRSERSTDGIPYFLHGQLGVVGPIAELADVDAALARALPTIARAVHLPVDQLVAKRISHDSIGMTHVIYEQHAHGLRVVGGGLAVHIAADGTIVSVTNNTRDARDTVPALSASDAAGIAAGNDADPASPELVYVIVKDVPVLAWEVAVTPRHAAARDLVYVDAASGAIVARFGTIYSAKSRTIFDGMGGLYPETMGTEVGSDASPPTDSVALAAFDNTGLTYDCYHDVFQRDSYDDMGANLQSLVHISFDIGGGSGDPNNAQWDGSQMVYGDGDGVFMGPTARAFDVTAHELTHAVTGATAMLEYQDESGALNEAMSDIMSAFCEAHKNGGVNANTWLVGEDIFTPNTPGDALRYMANPTMDASLYPPDIGGSRDYYPERYQGSYDFGGVHFNSGIANLAFELLSVGGAHPRAKTDVVVTGIGIDHAGPIFERALVHGYFMPSTTFAQARTATEQAATDLYPGAAKTAVGLAWAAVGVGTPPTDAVPPTVHITSPLTGTSVNTGFAIAADASDDQGVLRVDFSIDGAIVGSSTAAPYTVTTDGTIAAGSHVIEAIAYDAVNHTSDSVTVTVIDPTCGGSCPAGEMCDATTGVCVANPDTGDGGGCCESGRSGAGGSLVLMVGAGLVLRRRRR